MRCAWSLLWPVSPIIAWRDLVCVCLARSALQAYLLEDCNKASLLSLVHSILTRERVKESKEVRDFLLRLMGARRSVKHPVLGDLEARVSQYAYGMTIEQLARCAMYRAPDIPAAPAEGDTVRVVFGGESKHETVLIYSAGAWACLCTFFMQYTIPCVHLLCFLATAPQLLLRSMGARWRLSTVQPTKVRSLAAALCKNLCDASVCMSIYIPVRLIVPLPSDQCSLSSPLSLSLTLSFTLTHAHTHARTHHAGAHTHTMARAHTVPLLFCACSR